MKRRDLVSLFEPNYRKDDSNIDLVRLIIQIFNNVFIYAFFCASFGCLDIENFEKKKTSLNRLVVKNLSMFFEFIV